MPRIKICGIKDVETARAAVAYGTDYLGFVFAAGKRFVSPELVRSILQELPAGILSVGVFLNQTPEEVAAFSRTAGISHIQLHGEEVPQAYRFIGLPIIKAIPVTPEGTVVIPRLTGGHYGLLDTRLPGRSGGTGIPFNWEAARNQLLPLPCFLAGGLTPANVREAIGILSPYGVDVSSGVERNGVKSPELIRQFIEEIRR